MSYKVICFDMDGTLVPSKSIITSEMASLLQTIADRYIVAIVSWGDYPQFEKQLLPFLQWSDVQFERLLILPTSGAKFYRYQDGQFVNLYADLISETDKEAMSTLLEKIYLASPFVSSLRYGELIEDRWTQLTFSALGQDAPLDQKAKRDPTTTKRQQLIDQIAPLFPAYSFNFWGTTSIDITKKWMNKAYSIQKIMDIVGVSLHEIAFIGDSLQPWGNDYPVKELWVDCRATTWPVHTEQLIRELFLLSSPH